MPRGRRPEEFFEVFREVQANKKGANDEPGEDARPGPSAEADIQAAEPVVEAPRRPGLFAGPPVALSRRNLAYAAGLALVVVVAAYLIGWQRGWAAYERAARRRRQPAAAKPTTKPSTPAAALVDDGTPELVDGKVFTLLVSGKTAAWRRSVDEEAEYLNGYAPFKNLRVRAYSYRDKDGRFRVCARGLAAMDPATRDRVTKAVRRLKSRRGKLEYSHADFYAP